nr:hypothetical protein [Actinomadura sp. J1-007]
MPRPLATTWSRSVEWQRGHIGPGGWRSVPHAAQRWTRSSPASTPSQKNAVSCPIAGRSG